MPALIFDLSEVLIRGLLGVEKDLAAYSSLPPREILRCMGGQILEEICLGKISEEVYLKEVLLTAGLHLSVYELKTLIRTNFRKEIEGMPAYIQNLSGKFDLYLLSDHAREWIEYISQNHPFLQTFKVRFYSFDLGKTKNDPLTFVKVMQFLRVPAEELIFIDDSPANISAAENAGIQGIQFINRAKLQEKLENY